MIIEVPTDAEYQAAALNYLNMAWDIGVGLVRDLGDAFYAMDPDKEISDEYWAASQPALGNAYALLQQSQEFHLKSRIATVSPFLLLARDPRDWPSQSDKRDVPFSAFRTIDAADLVKVVNAVCPSRISGEIAQFIDDVRRQRNTTIHHGVRGQRFDASRLFTAILRTYRDLFEGKRWPQARIDYRHSDRYAVAFSTDYVSDAILTEFELILSLLKPSETKAYFGFDKKARRYFCPVCIRGAENERVALAQLRPNTPDATEVWCFICDTFTPVIRDHCPQKNCKSNVLEAGGDGSCLVCW